MTDEMTLWEPSKFDGSDLLPTLVQGQENDLEIVGEENIDDDDIILPAIQLLQGMSEAVTNGVDGAQPGKFFHTLTQEVLGAPIRVLVVHHYKSNALFPKTDASGNPLPEYENVEKCISKDGITGDVYGDCDDCPHLRWGMNNEKPLCKASHNFIVVTNEGPATMRFSSRSYKAAKKLLSLKRSMRKNFFDHPVVVHVKKHENQLPGGQKSVSYSMDIAWEIREQVPLHSREMALETYKALSQASENDRLKTVDEFDDTVNL